MNMGESFTYFWMVLLWILGVVVSKGFWVTVSSIFFPPFAWYLAIQWFVTKF